MKYTIAILALVGALTTEQVNAEVTAVFKTNGDITFVQESNESESESESDSSSSGGDDSSSSSSDSDDDADAKAKAKPAKKALILLDDEEEIDHSNKYFPPGHHEMLGAGGYDRVTPANFAADSDDIFMRSMIQQYALEQKTKEGFPSGKFWMDEAGTRAAAAEVLATNK